MVKLKRHHYNVTVEWSYADSTMTTSTYFTIGGQSLTQKQADKIALILLPLEVNMTNRKVTITDA